MTNNVHGIIYAYHNFEALSSLGTLRTGASLPFCGRYRLIDFSLSSLANAGVHDVGVILQRDYQSLLDHIRSSKTWGMDRIGGGLTFLPPFGLPHSHKGTYEGCMEALAAVRTYLRHIKQKYVVTIRGDLCASIDLNKVITRHIESGADITAVCTDFVPDSTHHRFVPGDDGFAKKFLVRRLKGGQGYTALECYVLETAYLMELVDWAVENNRLHFHSDVINHCMKHGKKIGVYVEPGYARNIVSVADYYESSMDMLNREKRNLLFSERRVATPSRSDVSTYYGENSIVKNSLIGDGSIILGEVENCVLFRGTRVGKGTVLKNCIIMQDSVIEDGVHLNYVISDKEVVISSDTTLSGCEKLPLVIPKGSKL